MVPRTEPFQNVLKEIHCHAGVTAKDEKTIEEEA
jgi:hypothetical protein